jgi:3-phytase
MKTTTYLLIAIVIILAFVSCKNQKSGSTDEINNNPVPALDSVTADLETQPVQNSDDAADDPSIWYNKANPSESRIIGTNKKSGLVVYNLKGEELHHYAIGRANNVDVRYGFQLGNESIDIVGTTNRTYNSITLLKVVNDGELELLSLDKIISGTDEVYGFCFYKSQSTGKLYANLVSKSGAIEQYELADSAGQIVAKVVRTFAIESQGEGMVADDELGNLFIGEEDKGVWKFGAEPGDAITGTLIADTTGKQLIPDIEGITLYTAHDQKGYLIVSSQGNNSYAFFNRNGAHEYVGSITINDGELIDGTSDTDGIDVISSSLGSVFPSGFFIAQDGSNKDNGINQNQNFKVVHWEKIAKAFNPDLLIKTSKESL